MVTLTHVPAYIQGFVTIIQFLVVALVVALRRPKLCYFPHLSPKSLISMAHCLKGLVSHFASEGKHYSVSGRKGLWVLYHFLLLPTRQGQKISSTYYI